MIHIQFRSFIYDEEKIINAVLNNDCLTCGNCGNLEYQVINRSIHECYEFEIELLEWNGKVQAHLACQEAALEKKDDRSRSKN